MKWDIECVRKGEEGKLLEKGWEPFSVVAHDTSLSTKGRAVLEALLQSLKAKYIK